MSPLKITATSALARDHHSAEAVVQTMLTIADSLEQGRLIDTSLLEDVILFLRLFADQCQTAKEETLLFPALEAKCLSPDEFQLAGLRDDHHHMASSPVELSEALHEYSTGHTSANEPLASTLRRLAQLYHEHLSKEDTILLPLAEKILPAEELDALCQAFQRTESGIGLDEVAKRISHHAQRCQCHMGIVFI
ncbi:MAG TPA: hemerythrin domain-containing protein [Bryobacteraceae bacterium]|nr:hemerythrin domain-containing protein [Bryobacteraceae bacterium]